MKEMGNMSKKSYVWAGQPEGRCILKQNQPSNSATETESWPIDMGVMGNFFRGIQSLEYPRTRVRCPSTCIQRQARGQGAHGAPRGTERHPESPSPITVFLEHHHFNLGCHLMTLKMRCLESWWWQWQWWWHRSSRHQTLRCRDGLAMTPVPSTSPALESINMLYIYTGKYINRALFLFASWKDEGSLTFSFCALPVCLVNVDIPVSKLNCKHPVFKKNV